MKRCDFKTSMFLLFLLTLLSVYACKKEPPREPVMYSENGNFALTQDVSEAFGYDSILIASGEYPITFDKNKNGQLSLKILEKYGPGNEFKTRTMEWRGKNYWNPRTGLRCAGWGFSCLRDGPLIGRINCSYTIKDNNLLVVDFLDKVPFGEKEFENQQ